MTNNVVNVDDLRHTLARVVHEAMDDWAAKMGFDAERPLEQQADMRHLRKWRTIVEGTGMRALTTAVGVAITGFLGVVWMTLVAGFHR